MAPAAVCPRVAASGVMRPWRGSSRPASSSRWPPPARPWPSWACSIPSCAGPASWGARSPARPPRWRGDTAQPGPCSWPRPRWASSWPPPCGRSSAPTLPATTSTCARWPSTTTSTSPTSGRTGACRLFRRLPPAGVPTSIPSAPPSSGHRSSPSPTSTCSRPGSWDCARGPPTATRRPTCTPWPRARSAPWWRGDTCWPDRWRDTSPCARPPSWSWAPC